MIIEEIINEGVFFNPYLYIEAIKHMICNTVFNDLQIAKSAGVDETDVLSIRSGMKKVYGGLL